MRFTRGVQCAHGVALGLAGTVVLGLLTLPQEAQAARRAPAPSATASGPLVEDFSGITQPRLLDDGERFGNWRVVFDGVNHGPGIRLRKGVLRLVPQTARTPAQTNAALVISRRSFDGPNLRVDATWTTRATTRIGTPNAWETGWLVWDYVDNDHFTYLVLKPNGWEVGRRDPSRPGGQRFVADGDLPTTPIGMTRTASVRRTGAITSIDVDGQHLATFSLPAGERRGAVGMYSEDAIVDWTSFTASAG